MITFRFSGRMPQPRSQAIGMEEDQRAETLRFLLPQLGDQQTAHLMLLLPDGTPDILPIRDGLVSVPQGVTAQPGRIRAWVEIQAQDHLLWNSELLYLDVGDLPPISEMTEHKYPTALQQALEAAEKALDCRDQARLAAALALAGEHGGLAKFEISGSGELMLTYKDGSVGPFALANGQLIDLGGNEAGIASLGPVTAFAAARENGYTGTFREWVDKLQNCASQEALSAAQAEAARQADTLDEKLKGLSAAQVKYNEQGKSVRQALDEKLNAAEAAGYLKKPAVAGAPGQVLKAGENGKTVWAVPDTPTDEQTAAALAAWLDAHPDKVSTVEDGAISADKLESGLRQRLETGVIRADAYQQLTDGQKLAARSNIGLDFADGLNGWTAEQRRIARANLGAMRLGEPFDKTAVYSKGSLVTFNGELYRCAVSSFGPGEFIYPNAGNEGPWEWLVEQPVMTYPGQALTDSQRQAARANLGMGNYEALTADLEEIRSAVLEPRGDTVRLSFQAVDGYYARGKEYSLYEGIKAARVAVKPGDVYSLTSRSYYGMARAALLDGSGNVVDVVWNSNDEALNTNTRIVIPQGAEVLAVQQAFDSMPLKLIKANKKALKYQDAYFALEGKTIALIGDSITEANNGTASTIWGQWLENWYGCAVQNLGAGGTGFANQNPYINRIGRIQEGTDLIGVAVSFNDMASGLPLGTAKDTGRATLAGYTNEFFDALRAAFPDTPIVCYVQSPWVEFRPGNEKSDAWVALVEAICLSKGIPFCRDMYDRGRLQPWEEENRIQYFTRDDTHQIDPSWIHPNSQGHWLIACCLRAPFAQALGMAIPAPWENGLA